MRRRRSGADSGDDGSLRSRAERRSRTLIESKSASICGCGCGCGDGGGFRRDSEKRDTRLRCERELIIFFKKKLIQ